jgi:ferritin-like metal-binding protein YciE
MQDAREAFVAGRRDAHAMEGQSGTVMEIMSGRLDDYPQFARYLAERT